MNANTEIVVCTWNIAGARKINSLNSWDYQPQNIAYFSDELAKVKSDIICLQETHTGKSMSLAHEIAELTGLKYVFNTPVSPSHIDKNFRLGTAIVSRFPFKKSQKITYPYPDFEMRFPNGKKAKKHNKALQVVQIGQITLANTQIMPITIFGYNYEKGPGKSYSELIDNVLAELKTPLILCGDFNYSELNIIYPNTISRLNLKEALPDKQTRPNNEGKKGRLDHILYSPGFRVKSSDIIQTQTDHYLCIAKIKVPD